MLIQLPRNAAALACLVSLPALFSSSLGAQTAQCGIDRATSTLVGAGLGAAAGAIPATIVHRHDQTSSHRIVVVSISAGALIGYVAAGRDHPCLPGSDSARADVVMGARTRHAGRGALVGAIVVGVAGAAASTLYNIGCERDPCDATRTRVYITLFSATEGAAAGAILGGLIGWAWPAGR